jgi:hypothetical protein
MALYDLHTTMFTKNAIPPLSFSGDAPITSASIDLIGYNALEFVLNLGAITPGTIGNTFSVTLTENDLDDSGSATPVPVQYVLGSADFTGLDGGNDFRIGYIGKKRYVWLTVTPAGNTTAQIGCVAILGVPGVAATPENLALTP